MEKNETNTSSNESVPNANIPTTGTSYNPISQGIWKQLLLKHLNSSSHVSMNSNQTRNDVADDVLANVTQIQEKQTESNNTVISSKIHIYFNQLTRLIDTHFRAY